MSIPQVAQTIETTLTTRANEVAEQTGFVQRRAAQLDGVIFAQMAVLTWMQNP